MTPGRWEQIERIYQEAAARPAAERGSFLDQACAGDVELRAEVERMLACASGESGFLGSPAVELAARALAEGTGALSPGSHLGPYEIVSLAGVGGMGEVWKARDARLKRLVALKMLPREFTADPERRQRLVREARAASALNHPNIVTVYEIGQADGVDFIAMEYVEGRTLDKVIGRGLKLGEALKLAVPIADALAKAHAAGIVHRDLKPGNVMVPADGRVKLLDFGLAKMSKTPAGDSTTVTQPGVVLGTPQYMAPEQIEGRPADHRTDIFALGLMLYEMLAGKKAFQAESQASLMAAILKEEPPPMTGLTPTLARHLRKCLEKDPDRRWQSAADLRDELEWIASGQASAAPAVAPHRFRFWSMITSLCVVFGLGGWLCAKWLNSAPVRQVYEFSVPPPAGEFYGDPGAISPTGQLSPDGRMMAAITWTPGRPASVWVRRLDTGTFAQIEGTEGVKRFTWSPDSRQVAVLIGNRLLRVPVEGGVAQTVAEWPTSAWTAPFSWGPGGHLIKTDEQTERLQLIPEHGGELRLLGELDRARGESSHLQPQFVPDGRHFIYLALNSNPDKSAIYADSIDAGKGRSNRVMVLPSRSAAVLAPSVRNQGMAYLLTCRNNSLFAYRFDPDQLKIQGGPMPITSQVFWGEDDYGVGVSVSSQGSLALTPLLREETEAVIFSREGKRLDYAFPDGRYYSPRFSHDGNRLVLARTEPVGTQQDIWVFDLVRSSWSRFTSSSRWHAFGLWRRDDRELVYAAPGSTRDLRVLFRKDADGLGEPKTILGPANLTSPFDWSQDGRHLIYGIWRGTGPPGMDLWILPMEDAAQPFSFLQSDYNARFASFSPDGRFVAFSWNPSGQEEVYVRPFDRSKNRQWMVSINGGTQPRWSQNGRQIYFLGAGKHLMSAAVKIQGDEFTAGTPVPIMPLPRLPFTFSGYLYDVSPKGDRVVFIQVNAARGSPPVRIILNWEQLLKR